MLSRVSLTCLLLFVLTAARLPAQGEAVSAETPSAAAAPSPDGSSPSATTASVAPERVLSTPEPAPTGPILTLEECVARALAKNFDLRIQKFSTQSAREDVAIAKAAFDPSLQVTSSRFHNLSPVPTSALDANGQIIVGVPYSNDGDTTKVQVTQPLTTGTTVVATGNLNRTETNPQTTIINPAYDSDVALTVRQPLLRNFGTKVNRAAIERARLGVDLANLDFRSAVLTVVRNVETAYYNLAFAREQVAVRQFSLNVARSLLEENRSRRAAGAATDLEVLQGEVGVANARKNLLLAQQDEHDREDALLSQMDPFGFTDHSIGPVELPKDTVAEINGDRSYKLARENSPDYLSSQTLIKQLKIDSDVARWNRLPQLDLSGTAGYSAEEKSYASAARNVWNGDGYTWEVDATLNIPWGMHADKARYRQSLLALNREQTHLQEVDQNLLVQVRSAVRAITTNQEGVEISALATELSRKQYELEKARYEAGLSTFRRVQESQADWDSARVDELQSRVNLRNALADLARLETSSLQKYKIRLDG